MECAIRLVIENSASTFVTETGCGVSMAANERAENFFKSCPQRKTALDAAFRFKYMLSSRIQIEGFFSLLVLNCVFSTADNCQDGFFKKKKKHVPKKLNVDFTCAE